MGQSVFVKLRNRVQVPPLAHVNIGDVAQIVGEDKQLVKKIQALLIHQVTNSDKNIVVIDVMRVIRTIQTNCEHLDIQTVGISQTIINIVYPRRNFSSFYFVIVWLILFIGSAVAIMNFHEDVSMQDVQQKLYKMITGQTKDNPLLLQIPYSIGLGLGMVLFFNHVFRKRINEEPSPLEVEMFEYQQSLDQYVIINENKESTKRLDD